MTARELAHRRKALRAAIVELKNKRRNSAPEYHLFVEKGIQTTETRKGFERYSLISGYIDALDSMLGELSSKQPHG